MTVSQKIREFRAQTGLALRPFAEAVNLTHTTIARYESEHGNQFYYIENLKSICTYMHYDFRKFLEETGYLSPAASYDVTSEELSILEKLRTLSPAEKQTVLQVLEMSYEGHKKSAAPAEKRA